MLLDILFVLCKLNPDIGYRQGMHELLAPILWVVERDAIDLGRSSKAHGEDVVIRTVFDAEHIEHDAFTLFSQVMQCAKKFYEQTTHSGTDNPMVVRSRHIFSDLLPKADPELARHLESIEIVPQVFLMRWIRLLFGREFAFDDMLSMWDVVFAEDTSLEIVDYVTLAMLLRIRWQLLEADYNIALTLLLRYPEPDKDHPAQSFVLDGLYLRDHLNIEGSGYLVLKYSGRPLQPPNRSATPPALKRNITAFSGANAAKAVASARLSPPQMSRQRSNIESIMQSTAKNIYARGEKLGIGKAVRSAVDEVHKRAQEIRDTQTPSLPPRGPQGGPMAIHHRVNSLEERNRQLSKLLEGAVGELWDHQKLAAENSKKAEEGEALELEHLSVAIAKVQFVQVYLSDPSLPLPESDPQLEGAVGHDDAKAESNSQQQSVVAQPSVLNHDPATNKAAVQPARSEEQRGDLADPSMFEETDSPPDTEGVEAPRIAVQAPMTHPPTTDTMHAPQVAAQTDVSPDDHSTSASLHTPRPPLTESSYSWMLGQSDVREQPSSRSSTFAPEHGGNRNHLFGDRSADEVVPKREKRGNGRERKQKAVGSEVKEDDAFGLDALGRGKGPT